MAHVHGFPDNQSEHLDDLLGRGKGDGDIYGYQGENKLPNGGEWVGIDKPIVNIMTEAEAMRMPLLIEGEEVDTY